MDSRDEERLYSLEQVREVLEGLPHFREIGLRLTEISRGRCVIRLEQDPRLVGNPDTGVVHGGVITTILDSAGGAAALTLVDKGLTLATLDLRIDYLRMAAPNHAIVGRAECYKRAKSVAFVRGTALCDDAEEPVASFSAAFVVGSVGFSLG